MSKYRTVYAIQIATGTGTSQKAIMATDSVWAKETFLDRIIVVAMFCRVGDFWR
jgi:hypothetical protein